MSPVFRRRQGRRIWLVGAAIGVLAGAVVISSSSPPGSSVANLWVDTNGGTCVRQSSAAGYVDGTACSSFQAALAAASAADTIRVKAGSYGSQAMTSGKASTTQIIAEDGTTTGALSFAANNVSVENVTVTAGGAGTTSVGASSANNTIKNVKLTSTEPNVYLSGSGFTWDGGDFGTASYTPAQRNFCSSSSEPITISGASNTTLAGVLFYRTATTTNPSCNHLEYIRADEGATGLTVRNSWFEPGDGSNTATIFITRPTSGGTFSDFKLENNFFGSNDASSGALQIHANVSTCSNFTFAYNTYVSYPYSRDGCGTRTSWLFVGNLGPYATSSPCDGTHTKNRWQHNITGTCGTDSWTTGSAYGVGNLGFNTTTGALSAGSVAINAAETGSGSDYCVNALGSRDRTGGPRPVSSACDNGSDEKD